MTFQRLVRALGILHWLRALYALMDGVRIHPSARIFASSKQLEIGAGTTLGARCLVTAVPLSRLIMGKSVWLSSDVVIELGQSVRIGEGTTVQRRCTINGDVQIGAWCILAPNVFISSGTHPFRSIAHLPIREQERRMQMAGLTDDRFVWIQDDCWIGVNAVVCPGVTIGKGSVVGANSVVTRDVAPYTVVAGSPARQISRRLDWNPPRSIDASRDEDFPFVLAGKRVLSTDFAGACFEVRVDSPLVVALPLPPIGEPLHLTLCWNSATGAKFSVGETKLTLEPGSETLQLFSILFVERFGAACVTFRVEGPLRHCVLNVTRVLLT
jgi:acetyltransferase-like isoleucine patch superfamily enzyme